MSFFSNVPESSREVREYLRVEPILSATLTCDPPSGCKEMRFSSFPDLELAGTESLAVFFLAPLFLESESLQANIKDLYLTV